METLWCPRIAGEENAEVLAEMSKGLLRNKMPELRGALEGRTTDHHRFLLQELMDHLEFVETKMLRLEEEIAKRMQCLCQVAWAVSTKKNNYLSA
jgi:hypothetical protein